MGKQGGAGAFGAGVALIVFFLIYERIVNPYTNPTAIITQFLNGIWRNIVGSLLSTFGLLSTAIVIALIAGGLVFKSKSR